MVDPTVAKRSSHTLVLPVTSVNPSGQVLAIAFDGEYTVGRERTKQESKTNPILRAGLFLTLTLKLNIFR